VKVGTLGDLELVSVEFNLSNAVASGGRDSSSTSFIELESKEAEALDTRGVEESAPGWQIVAIGTGERVTGNGPIELLPKGMYVVGPVGRLLVRALVVDRDVRLMVLVDAGPGVGSMSIPANGAPPCCRG
jgi:hypothetical protein